MVTDIIPGLDFVAETPDGTIVGNVMYTLAKLKDEGGGKCRFLLSAQSASTRRINECESAE